MILMVGLNKNQEETSHIGIILECKLFYRKFYKLLMR